MFKSVLNNLNIPTSILKTGKSPTHVAYRTCKDEVYISNKQIDRALNSGKTPNEALKAGFDTVKISTADYI